jgi:hypothetical protein
MSVIYGAHILYIQLHGEYVQNKKFWEEIIAYFPLIRHGPHRKRNKYVEHTDSKVIS